MYLGRNNAGYRDSCIAVCRQTTNLLNEELQIIGIDKWGDTCSRR